MKDFTTELEDGLRLRSRWQRRSHRTGWRFPDDWMVPEVENLIKAYKLGEGFQRAAVRLGASRARQGVGVRETMSDLEAFFEASNEQFDSQAMVSLVESWVNENERLDPFRSAGVNAGVVSPTYFEILILDLSLAPQALLDSVTVAALHLEWAHQRLPHMIVEEIRRALYAEFASVDATATVTHSDIRILMPRSNEGYSALLRFVNCLEVINVTGEGRTLIRFLPLPLDRGEINYGV